MRRTICKALVRSPRRERGGAAYVRARERATRSRAFVMCFDSGVKAGPGAAAESWGAMLANERDKKETERRLPQKGYSEKENGSSVRCCPSWSIPTRLPSNAMIRWRTTAYATTMGRNGREKIVVRQCVESASRWPARGACCCGEGRIRRHPSMFGFLSCTTD